jgi:molecular chaperone DnaJ
MAKQCFYEVLGVEKTAGMTDIKSAYRRLAKQFHPDRNPGDQTCEMRFKEVIEAYDVLKDDDKRAAYDRFGHAAFEHGGGNGAAGGFDFTGNFADVFDDLFGEFMGGTRRQSGPRRGANLQFNLEITLEDAYRGKRATIKVPTTVACAICKGTGAKPGTQPTACSTCNGHGKIRQSQGFFTIERTCPVCSGNGRVIGDPCRDCSGHGLVHKEKTLDVEIPKGVEDGTRIRLADEGEAGPRGGPPGDLYIFLSVRPHALFRREGPHVQCRVPISMVTAAMGGQIDVPTLDGGRAKVTIPEGTQSGRQFRMAGKGMPVLRSRSHGDMVIQVFVETPVKLTKKQKELLAEFAKLEGEETNPESTGFFKKVKELWNDLTD